MTVKTIFKTLIGTVVVIIVGFLIIEMFNIQITQFMLRQIQSLAAEQSAQLFCQETYKEGGEGKQTVQGKAKQTTFQNIYLKGNGANYQVTGAFYPSGMSGESVSAFYNALYGSNPNYQAFLSGANCNIAPTVYPALTQSAFNGNFVTPANFGIPYLDPDFMQKAFTWNIAMLFGQPDKNTQSIQSGGIAQSSYTVENVGRAGSKNYINYSGYRVYVGGNTGTKIKNIKYHIFNTSEPAQAAQFKEMTNIDPNNLTSLRNQADGYEDNMQLITQTDNGQIYLKYLTVVQVDYTVEIGYEGITPIAEATQFASTNRVEGLEGSKPAAQGWTFNKDATDLLEGTIYYWMVA